MTTVTDADREAAAKAAVLVEMRDLILAGRADHHAEPWAEHREAEVAKIVAYGFRYADAHAGKWSGMDQREAVKHFINQIEAGEYRNDA